MTTKDTKTEPVLTDAVKSEVIQHLRTGTAASRLAEPEVETLVEAVFDYLRDKGYVVTPPAAAKGEREHSDVKHSESTKR